MSSRRSDPLIAIALFATGLAGYAPLAFRLSAGRYYDFFNLAFDFDVPLVVHMLVVDPAYRFGFKHPLMLLLRPVGQALLAAGLTPPTAVATITVCIGAGALPAVYLFLRHARVGRLEGVALTLLYSVTATQLLVAIIPETYGLANLTIVLVWLAAQRRIARPNSGIALPAVAAVLAAGVTITNAIQPAIAELLIARGLLPDWRRACLHLLRFGVIAAVMFAGLAVVLWHQELVAALADPIRALKSVWALQTKGPTSGFLAVAQTFLAYSFVAPGFTVVELADTTRMVDFRAWSYSAVGNAAVLAWLVFAAFGTVAGLLTRLYRPTAIALAITLLLNILFHLDFQFRLSVFIYAAHTHFLVFSLAAGLAPRLQGRPAARLAYIGVVCGLAGWFAAVNIPMALDFSTRFDVPDTQAEAPRPGDVF